MIIFEKFNINKKLYENHKLRKEKINNNSILIFDTKIKIIFELFFLNNPRIELFFMKNSRRNLFTSIHFIITETKVT